MAPKDINTMAPNLKRDITTGPSLLLYYYRVCQLILKIQLRFLNKKPSNSMHFSDGLLGQKIEIFKGNYCIFRIEGMMCP